jgi:hypothetical protein
MKFVPVPFGAYGSTDMGNVSLKMPSIHPGYFIGEQTMIHTEEFQVLAGKPEAHRWTRIAAAAMAMTMLELLLNEDFRKEVRREYEETKKTFIG